MRDAIGNVGFEVKKEVLRKPKKNSPPLEVTEITPFIISEGADLEARLAHLQECFYWWVLEEYTKEALSGDGAEIK